MGLACSPDNRIWIASVNRVQIFDAEGKFLHHAGKGLWQRAYGLEVAASGEAFICDFNFNANCIVVCRPDGSVARRISEGTGHAQLSYPLDVAVVMLFEKEETLLIMQEPPLRISIQTSRSLSNSNGFHGCKLLY